ncbi:MAG: hypothetical protein ACJ74T_00140 [Pyrinomonadaceae bacterium]
MLRRITYCLTLILLLSSVAAAQKRGPSTPEERAQTVRLAHALESDPLNDSAKQARSWLIVFLTEVPDVNITICTNLLGDLLSTKKNYAPELVTQPMFSEAAYIIEHPEKASDQMAVHLAGVEGALRAYEAILKAKPKAHHQFLDELIVKRDKGELAAYVEETVKAKCSGEKK